VSEVSIVIPAKNEPYLKRTVGNILEQVTGKVKVFVMLDAWWPDMVFSEDPRVVTTHLGEGLGMRGLINAGVRLSQSEFVLKCDAHCSFDKGFDKKLRNNCDKKTVLVPVRYPLDVDTWDRVEGKKYEFQYVRRGDLKGKNWWDYGNRVDGNRLPDLMTTQGSCWFMRRDWFDFIGGLDEVGFGSMGREAQEVTVNTWLAGGRVALDRNTWYAHWSKPSEYVIKARAEKAKSQAHAKEIWTEDVLGSLVRRFAPVPTWDEVKPRGWNRKKLYEEFARRGYKVGAEIGVWDGVNAKVMLDTIPDLKLYLVDPYLDYPLARRQRGQSRLDRAKERAGRATEGRNVEFMYLHSEQAAAKIPDKSLDFVYIDGNHKYDYAMLDIIFSAGSL